MPYLNSKIRELIEEYVHSERDRAILKRRLIDGIKFEKLAEEFDMSDKQIKRIVYKYQEELFQHL
jgi:AraC-like DNA-binding protein